MLSAEMPWHPDLYPKAPRQGSQVWHRTCWTPVPSGMAHEGKAVEAEKK